MANVGRTRRDGEKTLTNNPIVKEFVPSSGWTEDSNGHYLLVDLPGTQPELELIFTVRLYIMVLIFING